MSPHSRLASSSGALAAGWEKEAELATTSNSPVAPHQLSCQISANQHKADKQVQILTNIEKHVPRAMTSLLMSSQPISISHQLF